MSGRNAANTGYSPVSTSAIAEEPTNIAPDGEGSPSPPVIRNGTLYVPVFWPEDESSTLHAIDTSTRSEQWQLERQNSISRPAVTDERLVFVTSDSSNDVGSVYGVDTDSGTEQWSFDLGARSVPAPKIVDGTVLATRTARGTDGGLVALDVETGNSLWTFDGTKIYAEPAVAGGTVFLAEDEEKLVALDTETGEQNWSLPEDDDGLFGSSEVQVSLNCSPSVSDGIVVLGEDGGVRGVNACSGEKLWRVDTDDSLSGGEYSVAVSPAVADGTAYVIASSTGNDLSAWVLAVDVETGDRYWKTSIDYGVKFPEPVVTDDAVVVPTWHRELQRTYVLDREDGTIRRELDVGGEALAVDSHLLVSNSGGIFDYELAGSD